MPHAEPHPHHPHLPYREWVGGGAGEITRKNDICLAQRWGFRRARRFVRWTIARVYEPKHRICGRRVTLAELLNTGLLSRSRKFDPPRPLHQRVHGRHYDLDKGVSSERGTGHGGGAVGVYRPIGIGLFCTLVGLQGNGVKHVRHGVPTYLGLTP